MCACSDFGCAGEPFTSTAVPRGSREQAVTFPMCYYDYDSTRAAAGYFDGMDHSNKDFVRLRARNVTAGAQGVAVELFTDDEGRDGTSVVLNRGQRHRISFMTNDVSLIGVLPLTTSALENSETSYDGPASAPEDAEVYVTLNSLRAQTVVSLTLLRNMAAFGGYLGLFAPMFMVFWDVASRRRRPRGRRWSWWRVRSRRLRRSSSCQAKFAGCGAAYALATLPLSLALALPAAVEQAAVRDLLRAAAEGAL